MTSNQRIDPFSRILKFAFYGIGSIFLVASIVFLIDEILFENRSIRSTGSVVELRVTHSGDGPNYTPLIEFSTTEGKTVRFEGVSTNPYPEVGSQVRLLYSPTRPESARIDSFLHRWFMPTLFIVLGSLMVICAYSNLFKNKTTTENPSENYSSDMVV